MMKMTNETISSVLNNQASIDEAGQVASWFNRQESTADLLQHLDADLAKEWGKKHPALHHSLRQVLSRVAVALLIFGGTWACGYTAYQYIFHPQSIVQQTAYAARGERTQVVLQDGTRIFLNSASQISFPSRFNWNERRIHLEGEAYFEVSKNPHRPFIVEMNNASVTVLGTKFNVCSYENEPIRVALDEGSVRFSAPHIDDVMLRPGEMVCYDVAMAQCHLSTVPIQSEGQWREHRIQFIDVPLADVIRVLERRYNVTFEVTNDRCYSHAYTLYMEDNDLEDVLRRMAHISHLNFRYNKSNNHIRVTL